MSGPPSKQEQSDVPEQGVFTFTATQAAYMREKRDGYEAASKKDHKSIARKVSDYLAAETERQSGNPLSSGAKKKMLAGVRSWFKQNMVKELKEKDVWMIRWNCRLVFMKLNRKMIVALSEELVKGGVDVARFVRKWQRGDYEAARNEAGEHVGRDATTKGKKGEEDDWFFNHYQSATTLLMNRLTKEEKDEYVRIAEKWRLQGPPPDEQAKFADKSATTKAFDFMKQMRRDGNVVCYILLGWKSEDGTPVAVEMDFGKKTGQPSRFYHAIELEDDESRNGTHSNGEERVWRALSAFSRIPNSQDAERRVVQACTAQLIQLLVCMGMPHNIVGFPWTRLVQDCRLFIDEQYIPNDVVDLLKEPSDMVVPNLIKVYKHIYNLQEDARKYEKHANDLTFEIACFVNRWNEIEERKARVEVRDDDYEEDSEVEVELFMEDVRRKRRASKDHTSKGKGKAAKAATRSKDRSNLTKKTKSKDSADDNRKASSSSRYRKKGKRPPTPTETSEEEPASESGNLGTESDVPSSRHLSSKEQRKPKPKASRLLLDSDSSLSSRFLRMPPPKPVAKHPASDASNSDIVYQPGQVVDFGGSDSDDEVPSKKHDSTVGKELLKFNTSSEDSESSLPPAVAKKSKRKGTVTFKEEVDDGEGKGEGDTIGTRKLRQANPTTHPTSISQERWDTIVSREA
ncbi:hypothetical protein BKA70DRAFT_1225239 [Coprinopsis sp. MPI-PUGE-AT-0042]|nr:hypothetical protein BKA70DRAFT_1225239 [Coprinopsis sp. MPI-PUGE-AT-0042]